jgi:hypothetical protein
VVAASAGALASARPVFSASAGLSASSAGVSLYKRAEEFSSYLNSATACIARPGITALRAA